MMILNYILFFLAIICILLFGIFTIPVRYNFKAKKRKEHSLSIPANNWLYTSAEDKLKYIKENLEHLN